MISKKPKVYMFGLDGGFRKYIYDHAQTGELPNFKRLLDKSCFFSDCMPAYPSITPTCWAAITTGTTANRNGAVDQDFRKPGGNLDEFVTAYDSYRITAERFWEPIVKQGGKALIVDLVTSGPTRLDGVWQVSSFPDATAPQEKQMGDIRSGHLGGEGQYYTVPDQCYNISYDKVEREDVSNDIRFQTPSGPWQPLTMDGSFVNQSINDTNVYKLPAVWSGKFADCRLKPFGWDVTVCKDGVIVSYEGCKKPQFIHKGEWTEYIERDLPTNDGKTLRFTFRGKLCEFDFENRSFELYFPLSLPKHYDAWPQECVELIENLSFIPDHTSAQRIVKPVPDIDTYIECQVMNTDYHRLVISKALEKRPCEVVVDYVGFTDSVNHAFKSLLERVPKASEEMYAKADEIFSKAYKVVDDYLGYVLDNFIDDDTVFFMMSDHGAVGFDTVIHPHDVLEKAGLLTYLPGGNRENGLVDWSKTKAFPAFSGHIFLNLKGRDPYGIIEPEDYDKAVNEVIIALQEGFRDKGTVALAFAVENSQAGFVGLGGERCGDVVYGLTGSRIGGSIGGVHACQIPSARTKTGGDIRSLCIMKGPGFKKGVVIDRPVDLTDVAPTVMFAAGYPQPADATGGVIFQAFEKDSGVFLK